MSDQPKKPLTEVITVPGGFQIIDNRTPEQKKLRKVMIARCGHITRRLKRNQPLTGDLLELALDVVGDPGDGSDLDVFCKNIRTKLKHGMKLDDYEFHMIVDVWLLHTRLGY